MDFDLDSIGRKLMEIEVIGCARTWTPAENKIGPIEISCRGNELVEDDIG